MPPIYGDINAIHDSVQVGAEAPINVDGRANADDEITPGELLKRNVTSYADGFEPCSSYWGSGNSGKAKMYQADITAANHNRSNVGFDKATLYKKGDMVYPIEHVEGKTYKCKCAETTTTLKDTLWITGAAGVALVYPIAHDATPLTIHVYVSREIVTAVTEVQLEYLGEKYMFTTTT